MLRQRFTLFRCTDVTAALLFPKLSVIAPPAITGSIRLDPPGAESWTAPVSPDGGRLLSGQAPVASDGSRAALSESPNSSQSPVTVRTRRNVGVGLITTNRVELSVAAR